MMDYISSGQPFYDLVVIGASAGGIEALSQLVSTLPADFPVPVVVAQHLDPTRLSHLSEILGRRSSLPVQTVAEAESQPLISGVVYVVPPDRDIEVSDGTLGVRTGTAGHPMPSVDRLLTSAVRAYGERLIAVILTGSGSDGAAGAREVKAAGGTVVIEDPETASYPSMPASLAPTTVDIVAHLTRIGPLLGDLVSGNYAPVQPEDDALVAKLLAQVYEQSGIDFTQYKHPTILRRLQRRMAATEMRTLPEYLHYVQQHPDESSRLVTSFLIKVTEFFRDSEVFAALREYVLPDLIASARGRDCQLRVWSAGCATGEEPYSLAMMLYEALGDELAQFNIRIFATDIDARAIDFARRGIYTPAALTTVPQALREQCFTATEGGFAVVPKLRNLVIFGEHDLGQRPPFPQMDLVLCRNVLIYFTSELQKRALQLFAYALRDGGYLVLGQAETVTTLAELFAPVNDQLKVYRRHGERILVPPLRAKSSVPLAPLSPKRLAARPEGTPAATTSSPPLALVPNRAQLLPLAEVSPEGLRGVPRASTARERLGTLLLGLPMGVVVIDRQYDIQIVNSMACQLLGIYRPAVGKDVLHLVERVPIEPLRSALDDAFRPAPLTAGYAQQPRQTVVLATLEGEPHTIQLTLWPIAAPPTAGTAGGTFGETALPEEHQSSLVEAVLLLVTAGPVPAPNDVAAPLAPSTQEPPPQPSGARGRSAWSRARKRRGVAPATVRHPDLKQELDNVRTDLAQVQQQRDRLLGSLRELEAANQELMSTNLELREAQEAVLLRQEEIQAADEEVRTLNEELQATNEELETLNEEMEATAEELRATNDDLQAQSHELQQLAEQREVQRVESEDARARLTTILAQMAEPMLVVEAEGQPLIASAAYMALFGEQDPMTATPRVLHDLEGHPLGDDATPQARVVRATAPFQMAFLLTEADGTQRWFEAQGQPVQGQQGNRLGGVVTMHEITDRTLLSLEERFVQLVSHELRSPISVLLMLLGSLQTYFDKPPAEVDRAHLQELMTLALQQTQQLHTLIDDLSDLGRVQSGKLHLSREPVDVVAQLRQTIEAVEWAGSVDQEGTLPHPQIDLQVAPEPEAPVWISADPVRVRQIFTNLLNNTLTHAPEGEQIKLRVRTVQDWVEVEVTDNGPGIPATEMPYLFSPFRQVAQVAAKYRRGLGLGLFIVAHLVQAHKGTIDVHSEPGQGTTFAVRFPLASPGVAQSGSTAERGNQ